MGGVRARRIFYFGRVRLGDEGRRGRGRGRRHQWPEDEPLGGQEPSEDLAKDFMREMGEKLIREGETYVGGRIPVNMDGGLKAKGHPIGATGVSMIVELTKQLREEVQPRERQVPMKNYVALAHNVGGTGHYCYVTILRR